MIDLLKNKVRKGRRVVHEEERPTAVHLVHLAEECAVQIDVRVQG
jgi:hypothetical protein